MKIDRLGPYRILRELGRGGMGTVFEGVHEQTGERAAVKLLSTTLAEEYGLRERFEAEIETLRKLNHPHIVRLFGFGEQEGDLFYAMELVEGSSLDAELARGRRFYWREVVGLGIEICRALRHAHDRGVIHRDIKPGNLLVGPDGRVKLSDFGIARLFGNMRLTSAGSVLGTAEYMAPEQAEGRPVDPRTDLYSLGAVMYALLAGRPLFRAQSLPEMLEKQRRETPEPLSRYAPDVPAELERIIGQLLEKDPQRRIHNAAILGRLLEATVHALSIGPEAIADDAQAAEPRDAAETPALGPTLAADEPPPAVAMPPTRPHTTPPADRLGAAEAEASRSEPPPNQQPQPAAVFTPVAEEDLDRPEHAEPRPAIISWHTWALTVGLVIVGLGAWYLLQPPSADTLYERIVARTGKGGIDSFMAAETEIQDFLVRYSEDSRCNQLREYAREIDLYRLERNFERRARGLAGTEMLTPVERAYLEAIQYARLDPQRCTAKLQALIDLYDHQTDRSGPVGQCLELAQRRLAQLRRELDPAVADLRAMVEDRLDRADRLRQAEPDRARAMYRAVLELYGEKPWAAAAVDRARNALTTLDPKSSRDNTDAP